MSRLKIYDSLEIARFHTPPVFTGQQRKKYFSIPKDLWKELPVFRKTATQVGFVLQWGYFRYSGHFFMPKTFHDSDVSYVTAQLGVSLDSGQWPEGYSPQVARFHQEVMLKALGWKSFDSSESVFKKQVQSLVEIPTLPRKALEQSRQWLLANQIEVPGYDTFLRIITQAYQAYHQQNTRLLEEKLTPATKELLENILQLNPDGGSLLKNFKKPSQSEKPQKIKESLKRFQTLKQYYEGIAPVVDALGFSDSALNYYAYRTIKTRDQHTRQSKDRYLYLLCFLTHQYRIWQDTFVDIFLSTVKSAEHQTLKLQQQRYFDTNRQRKTATRLVIKSRNNYRQQVEDIRWILENPQVGDRQKVAQALEILTEKPTFSPEQESLMEDLDYEVNRNEEQDFFACLGKQFLSTHHRISGILSLLSFDREASNAALLAAIDHFTAKAGKIKGPCFNLSWLTTSQKEALYSKEGAFHKNLYRMLLFTSIADSFKEGTLVLRGSYRYRPFEQNLIDKQAFEANREALLKECGLEALTDSKVVLDKGELDKQYHLTSQHLKEGSNSYLSFGKDQKAIIETPKQEKDTAYRQMAAYFSKAGYIALTDLLSEVEGYTQFLSHVEHLGGKYAKTRPSSETFYAALVGIGCNIKIDKMAAISKGINPSTLQLVSEMYLNPESLKAANDCLIRFKNQLALPELHWNLLDQLHTVSDGQKYLSEEDSLNADFSYKYPGFEKALTVSTAIDERFSIFHSTVVSASEREAPSVIDIHLNNPVVKSTLHSTDSGGYTEVIFAVMHFLEIFYAPRLKNIGSQQIYSFGKRAEYKALGYSLLPAGNIDTKLIEENWEDILRLMVTLKTGTTTAYRIFKRLSSYAKQTPLYGPADVRQHRVQGFKRIRENHQVRFYPKIFGRTLPPASHRKATIPH